MAKRKVGPDLGRAIQQVEARLKRNKKKPPAFNKAGKPRKARAGLKGALDG